MRKGEHFRTVPASPVLTGIEAMKLTRIPRTRVSCQLSGLVSPFIPEGHHVSPAHTRTHQRETRVRVTDISRYRIRHQCLL